MHPTRTSIPNVLMLGGLFAAGAFLWVLHAEAWDLGGRSPVLNYDTAQYAVAARELAEHGRLATPFALPVELAKHSRPPWPLAVVQPGMVVVDAVAFRLFPAKLNSEGRRSGTWARPDQREMLLLSFPFVCFLMIGISLGLATRHLMKKLWPDQSSLPRALAGAVLGLAFLLDPEAQHLAVGPFTELPFTFGLVGAMAALALGRAADRPFLFGLLLGVAGSFRANMLWLAPVLAVAATISGWPERRMRVLLLVLAGFLIPLAPWWFYKWRAFGSPGWDLTRFVVWDGVQGRTWFSLFHLPEEPLVPQGAEAVRLLLDKLARNVPVMGLAMLSGPRAMWLTALISYLVIVKPQRPVRVAGWTVIAVAMISVVAAAAAIPWLRYVFPARVLLEAAGLLACWGLIAHLATTGSTPGARRALAAAVAALALVWGVTQNIAGLAEAHRTSRERGTPSVLLQLKLGVEMNREIPAGEPVMSNLGPELAWQTRRPVIHLALRPEDMASCRRHVDFRNVLLVFRDSSRVWPEWVELFEHPARVAQDPTLNIQRTRRYQSSDGFKVVWLELGPMAPLMAEVAPGGAAGIERPGRGSAARLAGNETGAPLSRRTRLKYSP